MVLERMVMAAPGLCWVLVAVGLGGCFSGAIQPRTADLAEAGDLNVDLNLNVYGVEPARLRLTDGTELEGDGALRDAVDLMPLSWFAPLHNTDLSLRVALLSGLEAAVILGLQQTGTEVRVGILDEDQGAPLSLAWSGGVLLRPQADDRQTLLRSGFDVSRWVGRAAPFLNLYLSHGPEQTLFQPDQGTDAQCPSDSTEADGYESSSSGSEELFQCGYVVTRNELRLDTAVGVSIRSEEPGVVYTLAIAPFFVLDAEEPTFADCRYCTSGSLDPVAMGAEYGALFSIGLTLGPGPAPRLGK